MLDKGQMIVILIRTKLAKNTFFVGDKNYTIAAVKYLLTRKTQQYYCMEYILRIITINSNDWELLERRVMTQESFPFSICDVSLPQYNTVCLYMLVSIKNLNFTYIGKMMSIRNIDQQYNSVVGSVSTKPLHFPPYALFATR